MGKVSEVLAAAAKSHGAEIATGAEVASIITAEGRAAGVELADGTTVRARAVLSNADPHHTFAKLAGGAELPPAFRRQVDNIDYACGALKINLALSRLPQFASHPSPPGQEATPQPHHVGTVHFETSMAELDAASKVVPAETLDLTLKQLIQRRCLQMVLALPARCWAVPAVLAVMPSQSLVHPLPV